MRYRSRPAEIEAVRWTGANREEIFIFAPAECQHRGNCQEDCDLSLEAGKDGAQGWVPLPIGYWVARNPGDDSDYWPVSNEYFQEEYEAIDE